MICLQFRIILEAWDLDITLLILRMQEVVDGKIVMILRYRLKTLQIFAAQRATYCSIEERTLNCNIDDKFKQ